MNISFPDGYTSAPPDEHSLQWIAANMRQADKDEVVASTAFSIIEALRQGVAMSHDSSVVSYQGTPLFVGGLCLVDEDRGCPWQLCTSDAKKHAKVLLVTGRQGLKHWLSIRPQLGNFVDSRNRDSIAWLKWLGFSFGRPLLLPEGTVPFIPFSITRSGAHV